jgi:hypothetical protein
MSRMISAMVSISLLASGCYSNVPLTKEEPVPENRTLYFILVDGSYVDSEDGSYKRIDGGYHVSGWRWKDGRKVASFRGTLTDAEI